MFFSLKSRQILLASAVIGLFLIEAVLAMYTEAKFDMGVWFRTGMYMNQGIDIYLPEKHLGYPPLWAFWSLISYRVYGFFANNTEIWRLTVKLPMILAQFGLAFAMWKYAQSRFDHKTAQKIFWFTLTGSFFIYIGVFWGQINVLSAFLTFLAFYAVVSKHTGIGAILLGIAIALKIYPFIALPAFLAFILANQGRKEAIKFTLYSLALPVAFTLSVFAAFQWDLRQFVGTLLYWTPISGSDPLQIKGGCMNIWSFTTLLGLDISRVWFLRMIWIPVWLASGLYWLKRKVTSAATLTFSLISLYVLFMLTYGWVTEQTFIDPLPFMLLFVLGYSGKRSHLYALAGIQLLIYGFSMVNSGPAIFEPLALRLSSESIAPVQSFNQANSWLLWRIRGILGLAISLSLAAFLVSLGWPETFLQLRRKVSGVFARFQA